MVKQLLSLLFALTVGTFLYAQMTAVTKDGKTVLLFEDGTWKYQNKPEVQKTDDTTDCAKWIQTSFDKVTGTSTVAAKKSIVVTGDDGNKGFSILLMKGNTGALIWNTRAIGAGKCIDRGSDINILFRDGSRITLGNDSEFNCDAEATVYFGDVFGGEKQLRELCDKQIETMRVWTNDSYVEQTFSTRQSIEFQNTLKCLAK